MALAAASFGGDVGGEHLHGESSAIWAVCRPLLAGRPE